MHSTLSSTFTLAAALLIFSSAACAAGPQPGLARPYQVLSQIVDEMPRGPRQQVRVLTASFKPGDRTIFHTHRSPVTVYVLKGRFTLELEGQPAVEVGPGQAYVEPPKPR